MLVYFRLPLAEGRHEPSGFPEGDHVVQALGDFPNGSPGNGRNGCHDWCGRLGRKGEKGGLCVISMCVWGGSITMVTENVFAHVFDPPFQSGNRHLSGDGGRGGGGGMEVKEKRG